MDISTGEGGGVTVMQGGRPLQILQTGQVIQGSNGQQIVIHAIPQSSTPNILQQTLQLASSPNGQLQVVPIQGGGGHQLVVQQQPAQQTAQILQTADGQTFFYSPVQVDNPAPVQQPTLININGNIMQLSSPVTQTTANTPQSPPQQNIVMMTVPNPSSSPPPPAPSLFFFFN
uniref:Uncharacterized protein n=1 Tax=Cacopsylla melanoneura TaxID=428564 RepID=A0A8D8S3N0_9HEMI